MTDETNVSAAAIAANETAWCLLVRELAANKLINVGELKMSFEQVQQGLYQEGQLALAESFDRYLHTIDDLNDQSS